MKHAFYVWSRKNYPAAGAGLLDRVLGWFKGKAGRLAVNDVVDVIHRTKPALVVVKCRDGRSGMNAGFIEPVLEAVDAVGGEGGLWTYCYPWNPSAKNRTPSATERHAYLEEQAHLLAGDVKKHSAAVMVLNAEKEWFHTAPEHVRYFVRAFRAALDVRKVKCRVAWSAYALPSSFPAYPWRAWCEETDEAWPQLYSAGVVVSADNYAKRAVRSAQQHNEMGARRIVFGGPLYRGPKHMRAMFDGTSRIAGTITPPWAGAVPCVVDDMVVWWSMDQVTEEREAVILAG